MKTRLLESAVSARANGPRYANPGQRPGLAISHGKALKERSKARVGTEEGQRLGRPVTATLHGRCLPRPLAWADLVRPVGVGNCLQSNARESEQPRDRPHMPSPIFTAFLDRDGVINRKAPEGEYITAWDQFEFLPRAVEGLRLLKRAGWRLIVVTNQRGVALGRMTAAGLEDIHRQMQNELTAAGAGVDAIYSCTHDRGVCHCRKPETGLFEQAQRDWPEIDFAASAVIGDSPSDMQAADRLSCRKVWIAAPASRLPFAGGDSAPYDVAESIEKAALEILLPWSRSPASASNPK